MDMIGINKRYFIAVLAVVFIFMAAMIVTQAITGSALTAVIVGSVIGSFAAIALRDYAST